MFESDHNLMQLSLLPLGRSFADAAWSAQANVDGARAIIKRCKDVGLVFSSSITVYGPLPASVAVMQGAIP